MKIEFRSRLKETGLGRDMLEAAVDVLQYAAVQEGLPKCYTLTIGITDDQDIARYNAKFRQKDCSTDVLSFPMTQGLDYLEAEIGLAMGERPALGDILVSRDHLYAQAEEYGHGVKREFCFLLLHGLLHLLGYDHIEAEEAAVMEAKAEEYLTEMGITRCN